MLWSCQNLLTLELKYCGPRLPRDMIAYPEPQRIIELPFLQRLLVQDEALVIAQILAHLSLPLSTSISIIHSKMSGDMLDEFVPAMLPRDRGHFTRLAAPRKISYHVNCDIEIRFRVEPANLDFTIFAAAPYLREPNEAEADAMEEANGRNLEYTPSCLTEIILPEMTSLEMVDEVDIHLSLEYGLDSEDWNTILDLLPSLRTLTYGYEADDCGNHFALCKILMKPDEGGNLPCPSLENLELQDFQFQQDIATRDLTAEEIPRAVIHDDYATEDMGVILVECLQYRASRGHRLKRLKLKDARKLKEETVELMRLYVDDLDWNPFTLSPFISTLNLEWYISRDEDDDDVQRGYTGHTTPHLEMF